VESILTKPQRRDFPAILPSSYVCMFCFLTYSLYAISKDGSSGIILCRIPFGILLCIYPRHLRASEGKIQDHIVRREIEQFANDLRMQ
jgi:hypothetical protein